MSFAIKLVLQNESALAILHDIFVVDKVKKPPFGTYQRGTLVIVM
jgi:hypothetical protein